MLTENDTDKVRARKLSKKRFRDNNKEKIAAYSKKWREDNPGYEREWCKNNKDKVSEKQKRYRRKHPVAKRLRFMTWYAVKRGGGTKCKSTEELTGTTFEQLTEYLEKNDHGIKIDDKKIHIDHIRPVTKFENLHCEFELRTACHYLNLQLLPGRVNIQKGNSFCYASWTSSDVGKQLIQLNIDWRKKAGKNCSTERTFRRCCCMDPVQEKSKTDPQVVDIQRTESMCFESDGEVLSDSDSDEDDAGCNQEQRVARDAAYATMPPHFMASLQAEAASLKRKRKAEVVGGATAPEDGEGGCSSGAVVKRGCS
jgi:hypothetical protein